MPDRWPHHAGAAGVPQTSGASPHREYPPQPIRGTPPHALAPALTRCLHAPPSSKHPPRSPADPAPPPPPPPTAASTQHSYARRLLKPQNRSLPSHPIAASNSLHRSPCSPLQHAPLHAHAQTHLFEPAHLAPQRLLHPPRRPHTTASVTINAPRSALPPAAAAAAARALTPQMNRPPQSINLGK